MRGCELMKLYDWNVAAIGKYVWWIESKADHLWVKWVHSVYIKSSLWESYVPTLNSSWTWRKICQVKEILKPLLFHSQGGHEYSAKQGYEWLNPRGLMLPWVPWVNIKWMIPRHAFLVWIVAQQKLLTQDRLQKFGMVQSNVCYLCGVEEEDHEHIFFQCRSDELCRV
ncbi:uncharacterized protein LOC141627882 [Silene latifolia]|uniref:uncharacterized protein LOC141627882 n=1 Tax=Silene latifolia TaxID=37657 RepID=UPI003D776FB6